MAKHLIYSDLPDEDKLQIDDLYKYKDGKINERKIIRNIMAQLRKREMDCTKDIMNLSQRAIGENLIWVLIQLNHYLRKIEKNCLIKNQLMMLKRLD